MLGIRRLESTLDREVSNCGGRMTVVSDDPLLIRDNAAISARQTKNDSNTKCLCTKNVNFRPIFAPSYRIQWRSVCVAPLQFNGNAIADTITCVSDTGQTFGPKVQTDSVEKRSFYVNKVIKPD